MTPEDLLELLKVLNVEQRLALQDLLAIPSWAAGTATEDIAAGSAGQVLLDRDLESGTTVTAKNVTGAWIGETTRVQVREGPVLQIEALSGSGLPAGLLLPYGGSTAPPWGVFGQGQTLSTAAPYNRLAAALGYTGPTFTVPDVRGRVALLRNAETLLAVGGAMSRTIAQANLPSYNLTVTDPGHRHYDGDDTLANTTAAGAVHQEPGAGTAGSKRTSTEVTGITVASGGSGTALDTTPANIALNGVWTI